MKNRLLKLQASLNIRKGERVSPGYAYIEPNSDYYTDYAIRQLLSLSNWSPKKNLLEEAKNGISDSLACSNETLYYVEYSEGYRAVYEFLANCPHDWEYSGHSHNDDAYQCRICGGMKFE